MNYNIQPLKIQIKGVVKMTLKELKNKNITCSEYLESLINKGYKTVKEVLENEKARI